MAQQQELLEALVDLQKQIHAHHKMHVKKDFSLMVADAQASKAIANARAASQAEPSTAKEQPLQTKVKILES
jgi:hypothetical protein